MSRQYFKVRFQKQRINASIVPSNSYFNLILKKCVNKLIYINIYIKQSNVNYFLSLLKEINIY